MTDPRQHIKDALAAMRGVDLALCSYAITDDADELRGACDAAARLCAALKLEQQRKASSEHCGKET